MLKLILDFFWLMLSRGPFGLSTYRRSAISVYELIMRMLMEGQSPVWQINEEVFCLRIKERPFSISKSAVTPSPRWKNVIALDPGNRTA